jgi:hypothetical protein
MLTGLGVFEHLILLSVTGSSISSVAVSEVQKCELRPWWSILRKPAPRGLHTSVLHRVRARKGAMHCSRPHLPAHSFPLPQRLATQVRSCVRNAPPRSSSVPHAIANPERRYGHARAASAPPHSATSPTVAIAKVRRPGWSSSGSVGL